MINDETRALYFKWLENGSVTHSQSQLKAIGNILLAIHDELVQIRLVTTNPIVTVNPQKETPKQVKAPGNTKG
jgi:predicted transcriptional regulator